MKNKTIAITTMPISVPKEDAFDCAVDDRELIDAICKYSDLLRKENVEVFKRVKNVIATDKGYYIAWYEEELREMEEGIDNPVPFKGKDGRMKVNIKKEDGNWEIQDLATLVAMAFCPNPLKRKRCWFKDNNTENCNAENIFWISNWEYKIKKAIYNVKQKIKIK